jgi:hypothetical protein
MRRFHFRIKRKLSNRKKQKQRKKSQTDQKTHILFLFL